MGMGMQPQNMGMGMQAPPMGQGMPIATVKTTFYCPKCRKKLKESKKNKKYNDIICDVCNRGPIKDVITCKKCDYDLCY